MARKSFASMSLAALTKLRDDVAQALTQRANTLKKELAAIGADYREVGRVAIYGRKKRKGSLVGRKIAPKYRGPGGETWAGRGAQPRWMREAMKAGKKADDFLIAKPSGAKKSKARKANTRRKKR